MGLYLNGNFVAVTIPQAGGGGSGSSTYEAQLVLESIKNGDPEETESNVINVVTPILEEIINGVSLENDDE